MRKMQKTSVLADLALKRALPAVTIATTLFAATAVQADNWRGAPGLGVPGVRGGVVTTSEPIAAQVGAEVLRAGGNAIDAAAAIQFALNVVEPQSSGIGGGGFMMIHLARSGDTFVVDSRERAPQAATPRMFESQASFAIRSTSGYAVGVPGTLLGVAESVEHWGSQSLAELLEPAIELAEDGFRVSSRLAQSVLSSRLATEPGNPAYDEARKVFTPDGEPLTEGQLLVQPALARTLKLIASDGPDAFYTGALAEAIIKTQRNTRADNLDEDGELVGQGQMTLQDLADYEVAIRKPVSKRYRGYRVVSMPPPSSGGLTLLQILELMERFPIGNERLGFGFGSTRTLNVMIEAMRLAYADRAVWMGDDDFVPVPGIGLLRRAYLAPRTALIDPDGRQETVEAGDPRPFDPNFRNDKVALAKSLLPDDEGVNTTHFSVIDRRGNVVTYTSTIESAWGTGLMVPEYGFLLNNELTDFNRVPLADDDPENFNPGANDVAPFKRPRSSMAPTMIFRGRQPVVALGSPGGSSIITTVLNVTLNLIDHKRTIQEAVDLPRLATLSGGGFTIFEYGFDEEAIEGLRDLGHNPLARTELGSVQAVVRAPGGLQYGAADKRRIGGIVSVQRAEIRRRHYGPR